VPERVFLHIGPHKSGSTYLQSRLWANRTALRDSGIHLPGDGQIDHFRAGLDLRGLPGRGAQPPPVGSWDRLIAEVRAIDARTVLVTDERLAAASSPHAARALRSLAPHDVHVIYAVREFSALLPSEWQERIKLAMDTPFETWLESVATRGGPSFWRAHCIGNVFARWNVARDHVHLLIVPTAAGDRNELWRRFASIIDAPTELPNESVRGNRSLGVVESETVRRVYLRLDRPRPPARIEQVMKAVVSHQVLLPREHATTIRLPESCRPWIDHQTQRRREFLVSSGCRVVGDPNELDVDPSRFAPDPVRPTDAEVLDAAVQVVGELTDRIARQQRRLLRRADTARRPPPSGDRAVLATVGRRTRVTIANRTGRRYFILIGPPAAGSRSVQRLLWAGPAPRFAGGVYLPGESPRDHDALWPPKQRAAAWEELVKDAERSGHRRILIINETLASAGRKEVRLLLRRLHGAEVHVIYVLRDLATLLVAAWQRQVRTLPTPPWSEWLTALTDRDPVAGCIGPAHDVRSVLERWRDGGAGHIHVLVHPRSASATELYERLKEIVGLGAGTRRNEIADPDGPGLLDPAAAEVVRRARERIGGGPRHDLARVTEDVLLGRACTSSTDAAYVIAERARPWVEAQSAARRSFLSGARYQVVGDLDELEVTESSYSRTVPPLSDSVTLDAATEIAAALVGALAAVRWPDARATAHSGPGA
jgi:hypothetical protein